jgi:hypothetical protein
MHFSMKCTPLFIRAPLFVSVEVVKIFDGAELLNRC